MKRLSGRIDFYDQQGVRRWKTMKEGATKAEAKEELRVIEEQIENGTYLPEGKVPLFIRSGQGMD
jgi:hypothetical protein